MKRSAIFLSVALVASWVLFCSPATGQIVESPISDILTVYAPDGSIFAQVSAAENTEDALNFYALPSSVLVDHSQYSNYTMFYEQGGNATNGPWSDFVGVIIDNRTSANLWELAFASDVENSLVSLVDVIPPATLVFEETPGAPFDVTMYLDPTLRAEGYRATFVSDPIPEPSTFLLLGAGLAGVGLFRRRFKK